LRTFGQNGNGKGLPHTHTHTRTHRETLLSAVMIYAVTFHLLHIIRGKPLAHFHQSHSHSFILALAE